MKKKIDADKINCPYCNQVQIIERVDCQGYCNSCLHGYTIAITSKGFISLWKKSSAEQSAVKRQNFRKNCKLMDEYLEANIGETVKELFGYSQLLGMKPFEFYKWAKGKGYVIYHDKIKKLNEIR